MAKSTHKFTRLPTTEAQQIKEFNRLVESIKQESSRWVDTGQISPETGNHRLSCLLDLQAQLNSGGVPKTDLKAFKNPQLSIFL